MNDEKPLGERDPAETRDRASGERADHQASPPGVAIPGSAGPAHDEEEEAAAADEPDPGEHPMP